MKQSSCDITLVGGDNPVDVAMLPIAVEYVLTTDAIPSFGGWVSGGGVYDAGATATVRAVPELGFEFAYWGGDASGTSTTTTVYMNRDKHVIAYFEEVAPPPEEYSLSVDVESTYGEIVGYVTIEPSLFTYPHGTVVILTAYLWDEYKDTYGFSRWYVNGVVVSFDNPLILTMDEDKEVIARFEWAGPYW